jgi:peptidyl-tRNA hydrolase, PTH2 family
MDVSWLSTILVGAGCLAMGFFIGTRKLRIKFFITKKLEKAAETVDGNKKEATKQPLEIEKLAEIIEDFKMVTSPPNIILFISV